MTIPERLEQLAQTIRELELRDEQITAATATGWLSTLNIDADVFESLFPGCEYEQNGDLLQPVHPWPVRKGVAFTCVERR